MYYIIFIIITIIAVSLLFRTREYFTQNPDVIPFIRPDKDLRADSCNKCAGTCFDKSQGTLVGSFTEIPRTLLPKMENSAVVIASQDGSYLDFISPGVAKRSSVFLRQQSVEQPMKWFIEPIDNYAAYIRTADLPYYYLFADKDGSVGVSLFRGNYNQRWSIQMGYLIANAMHGGYLTTNSQDNVVSLSADPITNWNLNFV